MCIRDRDESVSSAPALREVLLDILDTPVSPELLPADENGQIDVYKRQVVRFQYVPAAS